MPMGMSGGCSWCTGHGSGTTQDNLGSNSKENSSGFASVPGIRQIKLIRVKNKNQKGGSDDYCIRASVVRNWIIQKRISNENIIRSYSELVVQTI
jgi:hypothetical protein